MRNYRFKLSDMMPNAWFYKLRDNMNKPRNNQNSSNPTNKKLLSHPQNPRKSIYHPTETEKFYTSPKNMKAFDTQFPHEPPRRSSKTRTRRKTVYKPSPTQIRPPSVCICRQSEYPLWLKPGQVRVHDNFGSPLNFPTSPDQDFLESHSSESEYSDFPHESLDEGFLDSWSSRSSGCKLSPSVADIIIDMEKVSCNTKKVDKSAEFELISELGLRPILTKPTLHKEPLVLKNSKAAFNKENRTHQKKKTRTSSSSRKSVSRSGGVKIRNKLASKRTETRGRNRVKGEKKGMFHSQSFAIVKASFDPEQDFKDSMMEMIVENNIRAAKDLEDLLASYLSLNSNHYHDLIIKAFEQIWFSMPQH